MASDAEHLFIHLWVLCMSSLEKCLCESFAHGLIGLFVFLEWNCVSSLYILEIKHLSKVSLANIFSHTVRSLFILLIFPERRGRGIIGEHRGSVVKEPE